MSTMYGIALLLVFIPINIIFILATIYCLVRAIYWMCNTDDFFFDVSYLICSIAGTFIYTGCTIFFICLNIHIITTILK